MSNNSSVSKNTDKENINKENNKKKRKKQKESFFSADNVRKGVKRSAGFTGSLLINVIIVFCIVKVFSYAFNFTYTIFGNVSKSPGSREAVVIEIPADSSILEIGQALEDGDIIDDKYAFFAKVKVKGYGDKIKSGKFGLSASMNYDEILSVICDLEEEEEEE